MGTRSACRIATAAAAVAVAGALAGCGGKPATTATTAETSPPPPTSAAAPPPVTPAPRTAKWIDLQAGDCLAQSPPGDPAVVEVSVVDCGIPHLAEAYLRAEVPVNAAISDTANGRCESGFEQYTGTPLAGSSFTIAYLIDSEQDRTSNNPYPSTVICLLQSAAGQVLTGSARR